MPTTGRASTVASSVLNTRAGSTPSAVAAASPYPAPSSRGWSARSCTVNAPSPRVNATVAGVPAPATSDPDRVPHRLGLGEGEDVAGVGHGVPVDGPAGRHHPLD